MRAYSGTELEQMSARVKWQNRLDAAKTVVFSRTTGVIAAAALIIGGGIAGSRYNDGRVAEIFAKEDAARYTCIAGRGDTAIVQKVSPAEAVQNNREGGALGVCLPPASAKPLDVTCTSTAMEKTIVIREAAMPKRQGEIGLLVNQGFKCAFGS